MRKINYKSLIIRSAISIFATFLSSFGIGCYYGCGLGTDPISVFVDGIHQISGLTYGQISTICNVLLAILIILFERKHLGIGTIIGVILGGPLIDFFEIMIRTNYPLANINLTTRIIMLLIALITTAIGYGLGIACKMGIGCFQFVPIFMADKSPLDLKYSQILSDALFFIIGWMLGGVVGFGTILGVLITGYILDYTISLSENYIESLGPIF